MRNERRLLSLLAGLVLFAAGCARPPGAEPSPSSPPGPTGTGRPAPSPPTGPCVESCGTPDRPCRVVRERIPESGRPAHTLHYAFDDEGRLFAAWNTFVGTDPLVPQFEARVAMLEPGGEWQVTRAMWGDVHGIVALPDGSLVVHADTDQVTGGGALFRLDGAAEQLARTGTEPGWIPIGGEHDESVPVFGSLERTPQGELAVVFESPFAIGRFQIEKRDGKSWQRHVVGDFYQLQSPHLAVDNEGRAHAFIAFPGRYGEPLWLASPAAPEPAPVAGPFALEPGAGGGLVHVLGQRCTSGEAVCFNGPQLAGWELVYGVHEGGAWRTPMVIANESSDPVNASTELSDVSFDAREPVGVAVGGCGGVRLFVERRWNRPDCLDLPDATTECAGMRLEIVTFSGESARTTFLDEDLPPIRRFLTAPDGTLHALGISPDRSGIEHLRFESASAP